MLDFTLDAHETLLALILHMYFEDLLGYLNFITVLFRAL